MVNSFNKNWRISKTKIGRIRKLLTLIFFIKKKELKGKKYEAFLG
jgi:hypothetical protein